MPATPVAIRQTLRGVTAHTLNADGSYHTCILGTWDTTGDVIFAARQLMSSGFGSQFRLDRTGDDWGVDAIPKCSGIAHLRVGDDRPEWTVIPFDCLIGIPSFNPI